jgi:hypothetical protein
MFTAAPGVVLLVSGLWLVTEAGYALTEPWLLLALALFLLALACWLPVAWLQVRMRDLAGMARATNAALTPAYFRYFRIWFALGWPAFLAVIAIYGLMVFRPDLSTGNYRAECRCYYRYISAVDISRPSVGPLGSVLGSVSMRFDARRPLTAPSPQPPARWGSEIGGRASAWSFHPSPLAEFWENVP